MLDLIARSLIIILALYLVPGAKWGMAILAHGMINLTDREAAAARRWRFVKTLIIASILLALVSIGVLAFLPNERPWAYAALGLLVGFWRTE